MSKWISGCYASCRGKNLSCSTTHSTGCAYKSRGILVGSVQTVAAIANDECLQVRVRKAHPLLEFNVANERKGCPRSVRAVNRNTISHVAQPNGIFFPRVLTPCGHGAQVIVEGREEQSDGGEKNKDNQHNPNQTNHSPQAESPPSCSLSSVLGETSET